MTDDLQQLTDAQLSETFAVAVAGMRLICQCGEYLDRGGHDNHSPVALPEPEWITFATSADAVLPFLEPFPFVDASRDKDTDGWTVGVGDYETMDAEYGTAPTFARAACIALIRAKRAERIQNPTT